MFNVVPLTFQPYLTRQNQAYIYPIGESKKMFKGLLLLMITLVSGCAPSKPQTLKADVYSTDETAEFLGSVSFTDTKNGLLVEVDLEDLPAGEHGFHIHENPDC